MKRVIILLVSTGSDNTNVDGFTIDQSNPENVVNAVFTAAKTGEFSVLEGLCDPLGDGDGDTRRICNMVNMDQNFKDEFMRYFKDGKISGSAVIREVEAQVPILFGPGGTNAETFNLIQRDGKWYLYSI
ncbi:MAG: hypothetical protein JXR53_11535 [Bacteroidales bacterium]|nr:hypothetical protein [Bacteroidales bacterium]